MCQNLEKKCLLALFQTSPRENLHVANYRHVPISERAFLASLRLEIEYAIGIA